MSSDVIIRRATATDYDAVMKIIPDLYDGGDYMPTLYYVFLQTKKHIFYVAKSPDDGRLLSLGGVRISEDGRTAVMMSGRTVEEFRSTGISGRIGFKIAEDFPDATLYVFDGTISENSKKTLAISRSLYQWNYLVYEIPAQKMREFVMPASATAKKLTVSESVQLVKSGVCERFLRRFAIDYVPSPTANWSLVHLEEKNLLEMVKIASGVVVTEVGGTVSAISFTGCMLLKTQTKNGEVNMETQFYGRSIEDLLDHTRLHLSQGVAVARGRNVVYVIHFPTDINLETASKRFSENLLRGVKNVEVNSAYLASIDRS